MAMMKYPVVFAETATGFCAHVPDLPGCFATGQSLEQTRERVAGAIAMHVDAMRADGDPIPAPSRVELVEVAGAA